MKVLLRTALDSMSGYGNDGCGLAMALTEAGHDVHLMPEALTPPIPVEVAELLVKYPDPPFDLGLVHIPPTSYREPSYHVAMRQVCSKLIAWTMWEWEEFRWPGWEGVHDGLQTAGFDHLLCYNDVTVRSLAEDPEVNPGLPYSVLQGGYDPRFWQEVQPRFREWSGTFRYVMVGRLEQRKNPWAAVFAFGRLKDRYGEDFDAELHLKTTVPRFLVPQIGERWPGIHLHLEWWPPERLRDLYAQSHCYLAPSMGEGKNLPALEAQTTGMCAIATNYGGHTGWLDEQWAYPLSYTLEKVDKGIGAQADEEELEALMWHVYTHRDEARRKGELAASTLPSMMSWPSVLDRLMDVVHAIPEQGDLTRKMGTVSIA